MTRACAQADSVLGGARALWGAGLGTGLVLILLAAPASSVEWHETARLDGVVVTERSVPGQRVPTFRAIGLVEADLGTVLRVIQDVDRHPEWFEDCSASRVVARDSARVSYIYHRTNVPWPLADRDVILRTEVEIVEPGRVVFVRFRGSPETAPLVDGVVRIRTIDGYYRLEALARRRTSVEYRVDVEPTGSIPGWIQTRVTRAIPLGTVLGLRRQSLRMADDPTVVLAAESQATVNATAVAGVVASDLDAPTPTDVTATTSAPDTAYFQ